MASKYSISTVFKAVDKVTKPVRKMTGSIQNLTEKTEAGLRKIDAATSKVTDGIFSLGATGAKSAATITAALVVGAGAINHMKVEQDNMTRAMGASVKTVEAVTSGIKGIGLNAENVTDLYEEMNNKLGESAGIEEITAVTESLGILGLQFRDIQKLSPDEQFKAITNAALQMEDATQAAAAADMLMGGEANKVISALRMQGKTMDDIIGNYQMLSFRTDQSRKGAEDMAKAQQTMMQITGSLTQEISGLLGKALAPLIVKFNEFMINNKELINQNLEKLFASIGTAIGDITPHLESAFKWIGSLGEHFNEFVEWAKWVGKLALVIGSLMIGLKIFIGIMTAVNLVMAANPISLMIIAVIALGAAFAFAVKKIYDNWDGITEYFGGIWENIKTNFNIGVEFIKSAFDWNPIDMVKAKWDGLKTYFADLFSGIINMYDSTIGAISGGIDNLTSSVSGFLGFSSEDESPQLTTEETASPQQRAQVAMSETITRTIQDSRETVDINVTGQNGAQVSSPMQSPRLNLINTAN